MPSTMTVERELPLFPTRPAAQRHSPTSVAAAYSLAPERLSDLHRQVLAYLGQHPEGQTDEEIAAGLELSQNTARPRRVELVRRGLVVEAGQRKTRSNRQAVAWRRA